MRVKQMVDRYGPIWTVGYNLWRIVRGIWNPTSAAAREISGVFHTKLARVFSDRVRARLMQEFVFEIGRAAIDLYSGRLALSEAELQLARERDRVSAAAGRLHRLCRRDGVVE
jgi:hypothetical protein